MFGRVNLFKTVLQLFNCLLSVSTWVFKPYKYFTAPLTPFKSVAKCSVRIWLHLWPASKVWSQLLHLWLHLWRASKVKSNLPAYLRIWLRLFYPCQRNKQRGYIFGGIFDACQMKELYSILTTDSSAFRTRVFLFFGKKKNSCKLLYY